MKEPLYHEAAHNRRAWPVLLPAKPRSLAVTAGLLIAVLCCPDTLLFSQGNTTVGAERQRKEHLAPMQKFLWKLPNGTIEYSSNRGRSWEIRTPVRMEKAKWSYRTPVQQHKATSDRKPSGTVLESGQAPGIEWETVEAGDLHDPALNVDFLKATYIIETSDGGYIASGPAGEGLRTGVVRFTPEGKKQWKFIFQDPPIGIKPGIVTENQGICRVTAFRSNSSTSASGVLYHAALDRNGDTLWSRFEKTKETSLERMPKIALLGDGSYFLATSPTSTAGQGNVIIRKTDTLGRRVWEKWFTTETNNPITPASIIQTRDGGALMLASIGAPGQQSDLLLIKTDTEGSLQWQKRYETENNDAATELAETDLGYIVLSTEIAKQTGNYAMYFLHVDTQGNALWEKRIQAGRVTQATSLCVLQDGTILGAGSSGEFDASDSKPDPATIDFFLAAIRGDGKEIWTKQFGDDELNTLNYAMQGSDGSLIVGGVSANKMYIGKLLLAPTGVETTPPDAIAGTSIEVSPNPAYNSFTVRYESATLSAVSFILTDNLGRVIKQQDGTIEPGAHFATFDTSFLSNGIYLLHIVDGQYRVVQKVVIAR